MTDLLVRLYDLPDPRLAVNSLAAKKIYIQRAMASEKNRIVRWVKKQFGDGWAAECEISFARMPITCSIAVTAGQLAGFACHDCTYGNFLGPIGISPDFRQKGVGRALLLVTLASMSHAGFAYAVIGGAGPTAFFEKCVGAIPIPGSSPGIYRPSHRRIQKGNDTLSPLL